MLGIDIGCPPLVQRVCSQKSFCGQYPDGGPGKFHFDIPILPSRSWWSHIYVYAGPRSLGGKKCDFHVLDSISPSVSFGVDLTRDARTIAAALAVGFEILFFTIITT